MEKKGKLLAVKIVIKDESQKDKPQNDQVSPETCGEKLGRFAEDMVAVRFTDSHLPALPQRVGWREVQDMTKILAEPSGIGRFLLLRENPNVEPKAVRNAVRAVADEYFGSRELPYRFSIMRNPGRIAELKEEFLWQCGLDQKLVPSDTRGYMQDYVDIAGDLFVGDPRGIKQLFLHAVVDRR